MNHFSMLISSPSLWFGAVTFRANRLDIYESLIAKLDLRGRSATQTVTEVFDEWARREHKRGETLGFVYSHVQRRTSTGASLADALKPFVDNDEYLILVGGEARGDLLYALHALRTNIEAKRQMADVVLAAMWMPMAGLCSLLVLSIGMGIYLWPSFVRAIPAPFWPEWTRPCIAVHLWMGKHWPAGAGLLLLAMAYSATKDRWTGRIRQVFDWAPPWAVYKGRIAANTLSTLAALVGTGMSVREAVVTMRDHAAPYLAWHLSRIIRRYDANADDGIAALRAGLFSVRMMDRLEDASAGRSFDETLREVGTRSMALVIRALRAQTATAATLVMWLVISLFFYVTAVTVFGIQEATEAQISSVGGANAVPP